MENNRRMILVGLACLTMGVLLGYLLCSSGSSSSGSSEVPSVLSISKNTSPIRILDARLSIDTARVRITRFRHDSTVTILSRQSWEVKRTTLETILKQTDESGALVTAVQFYPAFDKEYKGLTLIMAGRSGKKLVLKQKSGEIGELWDYIGPCPPDDCPKGEDRITQ